MKLTNLLAGAAAAGLLTLGFAGAANAAPNFVNGGFEDGVSTGWDLMTPANTPGWTAIYGAGDLFPRLNLNQSCGGPYGNNNDGCQFATIGAIEDGGTSILEQTVGGFTPGKSYTLHWLQASEYVDSDVLNVSLTGATGGGNFASNPYPGNNQFWYSWQDMSTSFVANQANVTFDFQSFGTNYEPGVDDFNISGAGVPKSATWAMMVVGMGLVGGGLRMSRRKAALTPA